MTNKFKKYISIILVVFLMLNTLSPGISFAEEPTPTPTETTVDNGATVENSTDTTSNTGDNSINPTPTPTPGDTTTTDQTTTSEDQTTTSSDPTPTPTISEDQTITSENSAEITNDISSQSNTGENTIASDSASLDSTSEEATPSASLEQTSTGGEGQEGGSINTGDATSVTSLLNNINTTNVNAKVINQTINIFVEENGNINLSDPFLIATEAIQNHPEDPVINLSVTNVNNYAYLSNDVVSFASTGANSINGTDAVINTGNAYSVVSLLNNVNFTLVDSNVHVVVINIFGNLNGNIILPNFGQSQSTNCSGCGISLTVNNNADVSNSVESAANTGQNNITGNGSIESGNATSIVNNLNVVNMNIFGVNTYALYINNLGVWNGNFVGWDGFGPQAGGASLIFYSLSPGNISGETGCFSCTGDLNINNNAYVFNNVSSFANTGQNATTGSNGSVSTGNAYSAVSLINFINTNFINSLGFFGFINIFGDWTGNIGGKAEFEALEAGNQEPENQESNSSNPQQSDIREQGGLLNVTQTNNVGEYVLPGDTVTFFVKVKNPGIGKVYETKLNLYLIKDGKIAGGTTFDLGAIPAGRAVNLTTGFVLSKNAPGGHYTARAYAWGQVGPNNDKIEATGDSEFDIFGTQNLAQSLGGGLNNKPPKSVLGANTNSEQVSLARQAEKLLYLSVLMLIIFTYVFIRLIRKKELVMATITSKSFKEKVLALRMFLL